MNPNTSRTFSVTARGVIAMMLIFMPACGDDDASNTPHDEAFRLTLLDECGESYDLDMAEATLPTPVYEDVSCETFALCLAQNCHGQEESPGACLEEYYDPCTDLSLGTGGGGDTPRTGGDNRYECYEECMYHCRGGSEEWCEDMCTESCFL